MNKDELVTIRPYKESDKNLVFATWLNGLKYGNEWYNIIPSKVYYKAYQAILEQLLATGALKIKIACLIDSPDTILGYAAMNQNETVLHWIFTKTAWRNIGIAKDLVPSSITTTTHLTKTGVSLLKKYPHISFNPFILGEI